MTHRTTILLGALAIIVLTLLAYRALPPRPFAADDFQWLLGARTLSFDEMVRSAFDFNQSHFFRPLVWVVFWTQEKLFGITPHGYHAVSLVLHLANAALVGLLVWRLARHSGQTALLAAALVALHPAPFEAVVWVSAQSELLATLWLLLMLHAWVGQRVLLASLFLALALLTKESAIIGLPLLVLLGLWHHPEVRGQGSGVRGQNTGRRLVRYLPPVLLTLAYLGLQLRVERDNYLVEQGGYGIGPQLVLNPLRSLGLLVAPLPGTEHADATWLPVIGALVLAGLLVWLLIRWRATPTNERLRVAVPLGALAIMLLPTAPFSSPPDSRYLYLPVIGGTLLVAALIGQHSHYDRTEDERRKTEVHISVFRLSSFVFRRNYQPFLGKVPATATWAVVLVLFAAAVYAREARFAIATGADGSLFTVAAARCATQPTDRVIITGAPIAEVHARAILALACGDTITPIFADTLEMAEANLERDSLVIGFPNGSAQILREM